MVAGGAGVSIGRGAKLSMNKLFAGTPWGFRFGVRLYD